MKIEGIVVYLTGGASGLGEETAKALHAAGAKLSLADMNEEQGVALATKLGETSCMFSKVDVTNEEQVAASIDATVKKFGAVHAVVNCAGVAFPMMTLTSKGPVNSATFKKVVDINLHGTLYGSIHGAKYMAKQEKLNEFGERGVIINIASVAAFEG